VASYREIESVDQRAHDARTNRLGDRRTKEVGEELGGGPRSWRCRTSSTGLAGEADAFEMEGCFKRRYDRK
jgi:hypothetical protein